MITGDYSSPPPLPHSQQHYCLTNLSVGQSKVTFPPPTISPPPFFSYYVPLFILRLGGEGRGPGRGLFNFGIWKAIVY